MRRNVTAAAALACALSAANASAVVAPAPIQEPRVVVSPVTTVTAPAPQLGDFWVFLDSSTVKPEGVEVCF